jgi:hypothetical protein
LLGQSPNQVWRKARLRTVGEDELAQALEVRRPVLVRNDGSVMHESQFFQVPKTFLCGKKAILVTSLYDPRRIHLEFDDKRYDLTRVDAVHNGASGRKKQPNAQPTNSPVASTGFDPNDARKRRSSNGSGGGTDE